MSYKATFLCLINFPVCGQKKLVSGFILTVLMYQRKTAETHLMKVYTFTSSEAVAM